MMIILFLTSCAIASLLAAILAFQLRSKDLKTNTKQRALPPPLKKPTQSSYPSPSFSPDPARLFDYLRTQTDSEILSAILGEIPLYASVALQFISHSQRLRILQSLSPQERLLIESMNDSVKRLPSNELIRIHERLHRKRTPKNETTPTRSDAEFWEAALKKTPAREALVEALAKTRPDLKGLVDRYRIRVKDIPTLPRAELEMALSKLTDRDLCSALAACPSDVVDSLLNRLSPQRRLRIVARHRIQGNLAKTFTEPALQLLLRRCHEATG